MKLLVSDTGPLNYLIQIEAVDVLGNIATEVMVPASVEEELKSPKAPAEVREWSRSPPVWLTIVDDSLLAFDPSSPLSKTDWSVLTLARKEHAILLMDDLAGREMAKSLGIIVIGTLGVLLVAAERMLVDFPTAMRRLQSTSIHLSPRLVEVAWARYEALRLE